MSTTCLWMKKFLTSLKVFKLVLIFKHSAFNLWHSVNSLNKLASDDMKHQEAPENYEI